MAQFDITGFDEFLADLSSWDVDRLAPLMLQEAVVPLERNVRAETARHHRTGDMEGSIKKTGASMGASGNYYICVRPTGTDRKGVRNMEKMAYAEYGTSKQPATPILTPAVHKSEAEVYKAMQDVFDRETGK